MKATFNQLRGRFIAGKADWDFHQQLKSFAQLIDGQLSQNSDSSKSGSTQNTATGVKTGNIAAGGDAIIGGEKRNEQSTTGDGNLSFQGISGSTINVNTGGNTPAQQTSSEIPKKSAEPEGTPKQKAQHHHDEGDFKKALKLMIAYFEEQDETEEANILRINLASFNQTEKQHSAGTISQADYKLAMAKVSQSIVRGLEEMD